MPRILVVLASSLFVVAAIATASASLGPGGTSAGPASADTATPTPLMTATPTPVPGSFTPSFTVTIDDDSVPDEPYTVPLDDDCKVAPGTFPNGVPCEMDVQMSIPANQPLASVTTQLPQPDFSIASGPAVPNGSLVAAFGFGLNISLGSGCNYPIGVPYPSTSLYDAALPANTVGFDDDGDTLIDEDPVDGIDNDGDTRIDEDAARVFAFPEGPNQNGPVTPSDFDNPGDFNTRLLADRGLRRIMDSGAVFWAHYTGQATGVFTAVNIFIFNAGTSWIQYMITGNPTGTPAAPGSQCTPFFTHTDYLGSTPSGQTLRQCNSVGTKTIIGDFTRADTGQIATVSDSVSCSSAIFPFVVLVHGWAGKCSKLGILEHWIEDQLVRQHKFPNAATASSHVVCFDDPNDRRADGYYYKSGTQANAARLASFISKLPKADIRDGKVDIVAHSFGGLVSRYYIEQMGGASKVRSLTMLGTPNEGTLWTNLVRWFPTNRDDTALKDMTPGSKLIKNLNTGWYARSTTYRAIAGTWSAPAFGWLGLPNDCVVPESSVKGPFPQFTVSRNRSHDDIGVCSAAPAPLTNDPSPDCSADPGHVFCDILQMLVDNPAPASIEGRSSSSSLVQPPAGGEPSIIGDVILPGQTARRWIAVDDYSQSATFTVQWQGPADAVSLTIVRPNGQTVFPSDYDVLYATPAEVSPGIYQESWSFPISPLVGLWRASVQGNSVPPDGQPYTLLVSLEGPISSNFSSSSSTVEPNDSIVLKASLTDNGAPIQGAYAEASVMKPDSTSTWVELIDQGDGTYVGTLNDTTECGTYAAYFTADGEASYQYLIRNGTVLFDVVIPGDAVGDPCEQDEDHDGITDTLEVFCGSDPLGPFSLPERVDGSHEGTDDNADGLVDEELPEFAAAYDCDGDGLTGDQEAVLLTSPQTPDTDSDSALDASDNCPTWPNPTQSPPPWTVPAADPDCDGFTIASEQFVGTDPTMHCNSTSTANDEADAWPSDFNDSQSTNLSDVILMGPSYNKFSPDPAYNPRFDLNASGSVNLSDVILLGPYYNKSCAP